MKKMLYLVAALVFIFLKSNSFSQPTPSMPYGLGSANSPYIISSIEELYWISIRETDNLVSYEDRMSAHYIQTADIDASETENWNDGEGWQPIGFDESNSFSGFYNGNDFEIRGLHINRPNEENVGLFSFFMGESLFDTTTSVIKNLRVVDYDIIGNNNTGGLVGYSYYGTVMSCYSSGTIQGQESVGGITGKNYGGTFLNCHNEANVTGVDDVGGIIGNNEYSMIPHYAGLVEISSNSGNIRGQDNVGGIIGINIQGIIAKSFNIGDIQGQDNIGGIVGHNIGMIIPINAGPICGNAFGPGIVSDVYSFGTIRGSNNIGGIVGYTYSGSILNSLSLVSLEGQQATKGPIVADNHEGSFRNNYWNSELIGTGDTTKGIGKTEEELKTYSTFEKWNFNTVWGFNPNYNNGYPFLRWQYPEVETNILKHTYFSVKIGPNPIQNELQITISDANDYIGESVRLSINDSRGRLFKTKAIKINSVYNETIIDVSSLVSDIYYLELKVDGFKTKREIFYKSID